MGCLRSVGSIKSYVSFAEYRLFYRALLQKRPYNFIDPTNRIHPIFAALAENATHCYTLHQTENTLQHILRKMSTTWHPRHKDDMPPRQSNVLRTRLLIDYHLLLLHQRHECQRPRQIRRRRERARGPRLLAMWPRWLRHCGV